MYNVYGGCDEDRQSDVYHVLQAFPDDVGPLVKDRLYINGDDELMRGILEEGDIGATLGLLINLLPNLAALGITNYNYGSNGIWKFRRILDNMVASAVENSNNNSVRSTNPTCKLREVNITRSDPVYRTPSWSLSMYAPLFYLPSMQSISVEYLKTSMDIFYYHGHHSSRLNRLCLQSSKIDLQSFRTYTKDIENLQELRLSLQPTSTIEFINRLPIGQAIQALLSSAGHSLRHLEIADTVCNPGLSRAICPYIGSLREFQVLETIRVAAYMFIAPSQRQGDQYLNTATASLDHPSSLADCFPPSVVRITFTGDRSYLPGLELVADTQIIVDMLQDLPDKKAEFLPLLESVVFEYIVSSFRYRDLDLLRQCREVGVTITDRGQEKE